MLGGVQEPLLLQAVHFEGLQLPASPSSHAHTLKSIQAAHARHAVRAALLASALESLKAVPVRPVGPGKGTQHRPEVHTPLQLRAREPLLAERARRERGLQKLLEAGSPDVQELLDAGSSDVQKLLEAGSSGMQPDMA